MGKNRESGPSATWPYDIVMMFCDLCLREIALGNRPGTHFTKVGWTNLVYNFKECTGKDYDKLQLKNKWNQLKKEWRLWKDLKKGATGYGWNPKRRTLDVSDEWWKEKIEEFPAAKRFKHNCIDPAMEEKLDKMFSNMILTGENALLPGVTEEGHGEFEEFESSQSLSGDDKTSGGLLRPHGGSKGSPQLSSHSQENGTIKAPFVSAASPRNRARSVNRKGGNGDVIRECRPESSVSSLPRPAPQPVRASPKDTTSPSRAFSARTGAYPWKQTEPKIGCPKSGVSREADGMGQMLQEQIFQAQILRTQIQELVDAATKINKTSVALRKSPSSITEAVFELDSIEELERNDELYGFAIDLLMQKDSREMFMALKPHKKVWYLKIEYEKSKRNVS